jgi:hypothetical protein
VSRFREYPLVVAAPGEDGKPTFVEPEHTPPALVIPEAYEGATFWEVKGVAELPERIGGVPERRPSFPAPGGSRFGIGCFPARSAGKLDMVGRPDVEAGADGDPSMHQSDTIDYEVILSGKIDIELPGGQSRTLSPGSFLVLAGVPHAWKNPYDEDCVYALVLVGAHRASPATSGPQA